MLTLLESGRQIFASSITLLVLATIAVVLRFSSKWRVQQAVAIEDAFILVALMLFAGYNGALLYCQLCQRRLLAMLVG